MPTQSPVLASGNDAPLTTSVKPDPEFMMDYLQNSDVFSPSFSFFGAEEEEPLRFNVEAYQATQCQEDFFELVFEKDDEPLTAPVLFPQSSFEAQEAPTKIVPFSDDFSNSTKIEPFSDAFFCFKI